MPTTTDRISQERVYGLLQFNLKGKPFSLEVYQSLDLLEKEGYEDYLFLPFTDLTNGNEHLWWWKVFGFENSSRRFYVDRL